MTKTVKREKISVNGIVQGVGFRPFIHNLAKKYHLAGFVANTSTGVEIEIEGSKGSLNQFIKEVKINAPPLSVITDIQSGFIKPLLDDDFTIKPSDARVSVATLISPDVAICEDCYRELFDPQDRRYLYPFINCTNCGPRYTIIENIPYDRPYTSMKSFVMCPDCQAEYNDPSNRRFHAQPNACPVCGPQVSLHDAMGQKLDSSDPVSKTADLLKSGKILAIKGLGGFHLAVDATNEEAVMKLRKRKGREEKPLAIMVTDIKIASAICNLMKDEEQILASFQHPIVLAYKKRSHGIAHSVAPGNDRFGIMLPYTPLHHILMSFDFHALVMTSANYSEEPICIDNEEAFERLGNIADYFLTHSRDIYLRSDDSLVIHLNREMRQIRRSRGYVPKPVFVSSKGAPILAVGGELKNTICLLKDDKAFLSQHIGDLENLEAYNFFKMTVNHLERIFETKPELIVYDLHPSYLSTQWAKEQTDVPTFGVQHHHAHLTACMAENKLENPVIGLIMDGMGYGTDGTIWGGEVLVGDFSEFTRYAYFEPMLLPGGDAAIKAPWRTAVSYLLKSFDGELPDLPFLEQHNVEPIVEMVTKQFNCQSTTSCGRLFDAVAAMSGGKQEIHYEAQAAIEFMQVASQLDINPFNVEISTSNENIIMGVVPIIRSVVKSILDGESISKISGRFHKTLIDLFSKIVKEAYQTTGIRDAVLSGGVFQNHLLFEGIIPVLLSEGFNVYTHSQVPTNDGGLSLGQAMLGRHYLQK